jgi:YihY family inner membrane protein
LQRQINSDVFNYQLQITISSMPPLEPTAPAAAEQSEDSTPSLLLDRIPERLTRPFHGRMFSTASYLMRTDVHTYAFSVAANAILSFFPFMLVLLTLIRRVFHSKAMYEVVLQLLRNYLPAGQEFVIRNLNALVYARQRAAFVSVGILLISSSGVFLPLEVALNRIWGFPKNRSYLGNQFMSLSLAFCSGVLALASIALGAGHRTLLQWMSRGNMVLPLRISAFVVMKAVAFVASIAIFFLIYWLLPNGKISPGAVLPAAVVVGVIWEGAKYAYILALPWLNFQEVYGPFALSVTLMVWAFLSGLLLLGGAHLSAANS